ncbi:hypothetical protein CsatB_016758 [Cannabis sativa]
MSTEQSQSPLTPPPTNRNPAAQMSIGTGNGSSSQNLTNNYTQPFNTLNQPFSLKLDRNNFTLWKTMVSTIIRGHRLDGFVNGTRPCPPEFIQTENAAEGDQGTEVTLNPEYEHWVVSDQLLMGWIYSSMTETIATEVMGCATSAALWRALENLFGAHSRAKMDEYRTLIQTTRKGTSRYVVKF